MLQLGDLLPADHVRSALNAIYRHNFKPDFSEHVNCQRTYVLNDEAGLVLCSWPRGGKPRLPFVYSDEVWTGVEYQVAAHLIYEGFVDEALELVAAVRDRHDGKKRNPWDEVECGHHYARSMSSWALLIALCGFHYNAADAALTFEPHLRGDHFRSFFSVGSGWGQLSQRLVDGGVQIEIDVRHGYLALKTLRLGSLSHITKQAQLETSTATRARLVLASEKISVLFDEPIRIDAGDRLGITLHSAATPE